MNLRSYVLLLLCLTVAVNAAAAGRRSRKRRKLKQKPVTTEIIHTTTRSTTTARSTTTRSTSARPTTVEITALPEAISTTTVYAATYPTDQITDAAGACRRECEGDSHLSPELCVCVCDTGFEYSSRTGYCEDINECEDPSNCIAGRCDNVRGLYYCTCYTGFNLHANGKTCQPIPRVLPCRGLSCFDGANIDQNRCECQCEMDGLIYDYFEEKCIDRDECGEGTVSCEHGCINTVGSYLCYCYPLYRLNPNGITCDLLPAPSPINTECFGKCSGAAALNLLACNCMCESGYVYSKGSMSCVDEDECEVYRGWCQGACSNHIGSYTCTCPTGTVLDVDGWVCNEIVTQEPGALTCLPYEILCGHGNQCIQDAVICDGYNDCGDGSDENNCKPVCSTDQFACANGHDCMDMLLLCNGENDCLDYSDELDCPCKDQKDECHAWRGRGECESNAGWMAWNCRESCGTCLKDDGTESGDIVETKHPELYFLRHSREIAVGLQYTLRNTGSREGAAGSEWRCDSITQVPKNVRAEFRLSYSYQKYAQAYNIPILGTELSDDEAMKRACYVVRFLLADRRDVREALFRSWGRIVVMGADEVTMNVPEHSHLDPEIYETVRGLGGTQHIPVATGAAENLLCSGDDSNSAEDRFVHVMAHTIRRVPLALIVATFDARLHSAYLNARASGLWAHTRAVYTVDEYFAQGVMSFFNVSAPLAGGGKHNGIESREKLEIYDPALYSLVKEVFPCINSIVNRCNNQTRRNSDQIIMNCNEAAPSSSEEEEENSEDACRNLFNECSEWKDSGDCENNPAWMSTNCPKSCDTCHTPEEEPVSDDTSTDCKDSDVRCSEWVQLGRCEKDSDWMQIFCQRSCGTCDTELLVPDETETPSSIPDCVDSHFLCDVYASAGGCVTNEAWMKTNCPRICEFCTDSTASPTASLRTDFTDDSLVSNSLPPPTLSDKACIDTEAYCAHLVNDGDCKTDREWMRINCRKSCGFCEAPTSGPSVSCVDSEASVSCKKWAEVGDCETDREWMQVNCRKSCGFCKAPTSGPSVRCVDAEATTLCKEWAEVGDCRSDHEWMRVNCRKSCRFCERPPTGSFVSCVNSEATTLCNEWVEVGDCRTDREWMWIHCRKSCGFCEAPSTDLSVSCLDAEATTLCKEWAEVGDCRTDREWMQTNCAKTCSFCQGHTDCTDSEPSCIDWANVGQCQTNLDWMEKNCRKSCGLCPKPTSSVDELECVDSEPDCLSWAHVGDCTTNPNWMKLYCPRSCGLCNDAYIHVDKSDDSKLPVYDPDCVDSESYCLDWAWVGDCDMNPEYMNVYCPLSCGMCDDVTNVVWQPTTTYTPTELPYRPDCTDNDPLCPGWAFYGSCFTSPDYMLENCAYSCNSCEPDDDDDVVDSTTRVTVGCVDGDELCPHWASVGGCYSNPEWMLANCKVSCNVCDPPSVTEVTEHPTTITTVVSGSSLDESSQEGFSDSGTYSSEAIQYSDSWEESKYDETFEYSHSSIKSDDSPDNNDGFEYPDEVTTQFVVADTESDYDRSTSRKPNVSVTHPQEATLVTRELNHTEGVTTHPSINPTQISQPMEVTNIVSTSASSITMSVTAPTNRQISNTLGQTTFFQLTGTPSRTVESESQGEFEQSFQKGTPGDESATVTHAEVGESSTVISRTQTEDDKVPVSSTERGSTTRASATEGKIQTMHKWSSDPPSAGMTTLSTDVTESETADPVTTKSYTSITSKLLQRGSQSTTGHPVTTAARPVTTAARPMTTAARPVTTPVEFTTAPRGSSPLTILPQNTEFQTEISEPSVSSLSMDCVDKFKYCALWASHGGCTSSGPYMLDNCPASCRMCDDQNSDEGFRQDDMIDYSSDGTSSSSEYQYGSKALSTATEQQNAATDPRGPHVGTQMQKRSPNMETNTLSGVSTTAETPFVTTVPVAISYVTDTEPPGVETSTWTNDITLDTTVDCVDGSIHCRVWAAYGGCKSNPLFMLPNCKLSCSSCDFTSVAESSEGDAYDSSASSASSSGGSSHIEVVVESENVVTNEETIPSNEIPECLDSTYHCTTWAVIGGCVDNPEWMNKNCKKSCNNCDDVDEYEPTTHSVTPRKLPNAEPTTEPPVVNPSMSTPKNILPCIDYNANCEEWAANDECDQNPWWMRINCRLSCDTCLEDTSCFDSDGRCAGWAKVGECEVNPGWMQRNCRDSCDTCDMIDDGCEDNFDKCPQWEQEEQCAYDIDWMRSNCKKSCGLCNKNREPTACLDHYGGNCTVWALDGECEFNPVWMRINCCLACLEDLPSYCVDKEENCVDLKKEGACDSDPGWMLENCRMSCEGCNRSYVVFPKPRTDLVCKDEASYCAELALDGECDIDPDWMGEHCCHSCSLLSRDSTPGCIDLKKTCSDWAQSGECVTNAEYMIPVCTKSCNACSECVDSDSDSCSLLAEDAQCQENPAIMLSYCPKSCNMCNNTCKDTDTNCERWADTGECSANPQWMLPNCPLSCDHCDFNPICYDTRKDCIAWAEGGQCETNRGYMRSFCRKSCKRC